MRKYQKAFVVVAMLGAVGTLGAGTAQAGDVSTNHDAFVCSAVGGAGGAGSGGIGINALNINLIGDQTNSAANGMGGAGGNASC
ncbi:hypothetical protein ABZS79_03535 [Streptomyces griseoloalbus]|uniref:hypothetical protein n=1 Tax=Streptomyces griseoloalbus TaxID=67303 RepID=UPI0033B4EBC1